MPQDDSNKIGVVAATFMVAGNMMGSGVFMLPANLAAIGSIALLGWIITCVGAVALALTFAKLAAIDPAAGGPYAYARKAFGDYMGYQTNLIYWLANVVGNVGLAVAGIGYLTHFFPGLKDPWTFALSQILIIWLLTYRNMGLKDLAQAMFEAMKELRTTSLLSQAFSILPTPVMSPSRAYEELVRGRIERLTLDAMAERTAATGVVPYQTRRKSSPFRGRI